MRMTGLLVCLAVFGLTPTCPAQAPSAAEEILRLVPDDMALCFVVQDLRGYNEKLQESPWYNALQKSPLAAVVLNSPDLKLAKLEAELAKHLGVTWAKLRDEVFGEAVAFAFHHGRRPEDEHGLILLKASNARLLAELIERINRDQIKSGELKELAEVEFKGAKYVRRLERNGAHYYFLDGGLLVLSGKEEALRRVLEIRAKERSASPVFAKLKRADAAGAFVALWMNPRAFDAELERRVKEAADFEVHGLKQFLAVWQSLDAVVLSFTPRRHLELVVSLQAKDKDLSPESQRLFNHVGKSSELWERFPDNALVAVAGHLDVPVLAESISNMVPPPVRKLIGDSVQKNIESALGGLELANDVLPNVGPDWGMFVAAADDPADFPHFLTALAVRPGDKAVDQALVRALENFAFLAKLADSSIVMKHVRQDNVHVQYLAHDKHFPRGFQPAFALKDGYLVIASSPDAIRRFRKGAGTAPAAGEALCLRARFKEIAKLVTQNRGPIISFLAEKNGVSRSDAAQVLDGILAALAPFERLTLSERSGQGQISLILRLEAAKE